MDAYPYTKYVVVSVLFFGYAMLSYNRKSVSYIVPSLEKEGITHQELGLILSAQNMAYALSKFLGGILSDQISSRLLFSVGLIISAGTTLLFSLSDNLYLFTIIWFMNGLAQGLGWPAIAKLIKLWFEAGEFGLWWSVASSSANVAGFICPFAAAIFTKKFGWRTSIRASGIFSLIAAIIALLFIQDRPKPRIGSPPRGRIHNRESNTERIETERRQISMDRHTRRSPFYILNILLRTRFVWVVSICYMVISIIKTAVADWTQVYLIRDCGFDPIIASSFLGFFEFGGLTGSICGGLLSDMIMSQRTRNIIPTNGHPRMIAATAFMVMTCTSLHVFLFFVNKHISHYHLSIIATMMGSAFYGQIAIYGVVATSSVAPELSGTCHALAALAANAGSVIAGLPIALLARYTSWLFTYLVLLLMAIATLIFMAFTRDVPYHVEYPDRHSERRRE